MALQDHPMWRKPQHHHDLDESEEHVHWVELFYDLIHVVTIFLLGNYLSHHLTIEGFLVFTAVFIVVWYAWGELSIFNSIYISTDIWHRMIMSVMICTLMFMAASISSIQDQGWPFFALAFAANRFMLALLYLRARRTNCSSYEMSNEQIRNFSIFAVIYAISAFLPKPYNFWVFGVAMVVTQTVYLVPKISVIRHDRFRPRLNHMAERFALLTLIVLGEGFFKLVITLSDKGIYQVSADVLVNFTFGGISMFVMCWIYFDFVGNGRVKDNSPSTLLKWWFAHLILMLCGVMVGVALVAEVKVGFMQSFDIGYDALGCFGLAGYIAMLWVLQRVVEHRVATDYGRSDVRIFGIVVAVICFFIVPHVPSIVANLIWFTALLSQIVIPVTRAIKALR